MTGTGSRGSRSRSCGCRLEPNRLARFDSSKMVASSCPLRAVRRCGVEASKSAAKRRFDRWARSYEHDRRSRFNAQPQQEALAALALQPNDHFLDVGCGTGAAVRAAAAVVDRAVGVDIAPKMIGRAKELAAGLPRAEFIVGDSEQLPFPDGAFTALLCTASFHHYPDSEQALAEMARVLASGGRLVIADGTSDLRIARLADRLLRRLDRSHVRLYRTHELVELVQRAGFSDVTTRHLWDGGYAILTARRVTAT
jgi:SAM-dependent methyltransferase